MSLTPNGIYHLYANFRQHGFGHPGNVKEMLDITKAEFRGMIGYAEFLHERGIVMQCGNDHTVVYYTFPLPEDVHEVIDITADDSD